VGGGQGGQESVEFAVCCFVYSPCFLFGSKERRASMADLEGKTCVRVPCEPGSDTVVDGRNL